MRRNQKGFTLMELMVVIVIVAILAAVAVPLYINYVKDATRTEAKGAIGAVITAEQTYFQQNPLGGPASYFGPEVFLSDPGSNAGQTLNCDLTEALINWDIQVTAAGVDGFTVVALGRDSKPTKDLYVSYDYKRDGTGAGWSDVAPGGP
jgi:prepilin-type N-terminal cleavage/methylation domain-containing protein